MIYLRLLGVFFKLGLFTIGGGYAMLPLIQAEIEKRGWITAQEFVDMIAVAEMTPGAIGVNTATFVGWRLAGIPGSVVATTAIALPSLILVLIVSKILDRFRNHPTVGAILYGIRPVVAGLIASSAIFIAQAALEKPNAAGTFLQSFDAINFLLMVAIFIAVRKFKQHPILCIIAAGIFGLIVY